MLLVLAVGGAAVTIAKSRLFEAPRQWPRNGLAEKDLWMMPRRWRLLDAFLRCPYCITHWLMLGAVLAYRPRLVHSDMRAADLFVSWLALTTLAALVAALLCRAYDFEEER